MRRIGIIAGAALFLATGSAASAQEPTPHVCMTPAETREAVAQYRLTEPFRALREAAGRAEAQAVGGRLCRWDDRFVYEITLLRRDGRLVRTAVDAQSGVVRSER